MSSKKTAVDWLIELLHPTISVRLSNTYIKVLKEKAKAMEQSQIESAYREGHNDCSLGRFADSEKYYNETFL